MLVLRCFPVRVILIICRMSYFLASERIAVFVAAQAADADEHKPCDGFRQRLLCGRSWKRLAAAELRTTASLKLQRTAAPPPSLLAAAGLAVSQSTASPAAIAASTAATLAVFRFTICSIFKDSQNAQSQNRNFSRTENMKYVLQTEKPDILAIRT